MRLLIHAVWVLAVLVSPSLSAAADEKPEETLASLKKEQRQRSKNWKVGGSRERPRPNRRRRSIATTRRSPTSVAAPWPSSRNVLIRPTPSRP